MKSHNVTLQGKATPAAERTPIPTGACSNSAAQALQTCSSGGDMHGAVDRGPGAVLKEGKYAPKNSSGL